MRHARSNAPRRRMARRLWMHPWPLRRARRGDVCALSDRIERTLSRRHHAPRVEPDDGTVPGRPLGVVLSPTRRARDRDGAALAVPPADHATWPLGFEAQFKRQSRNDFFVKALGDAMEARFAADAAIAYRLFSETIYTLGQERASQIALAVNSGARVGSIALTLPRRDDPEIMMEREAARRAVLAALAMDGGARPSAPGAMPSPNASSVPDDPLFLNVVIESAGFVVSGRGRRMSPGCREAGNGVAVPTRDGAYDFAGLTACAATLKGSAPAYATETKVTL